MTYHPNTQTHVHREDDARPRPHDNLPHGALPNRLIDIIDWCRRQPPKTTVTLEAADLLWIHDRECPPGR